MRKNKLLLLLALLLTAVTGAWAEEQVVYTLDGTQTASNNAYATAGVVNQGGMTWRVTGNTSMNPWRIGGKSLSGVDRSIWSENSLDETVTKVTLEFGTASSITVNSITMTVAGDDGFSDVIDTKAVTFSANNTVDVTPTEGKEWKNAYYRFVFNVTVSGSSNKFLQLKSIKFYNDPDAQQQGGSTEPVAGTFTVSLKDGTKDAKNWSIASGEKSAKGDAADGLTGLSEGDKVTLQYNGRLKVKGVTATSDEKPAAPSVTEVTTFSELQTALSAGKDVKLKNDIVCTEEISITSGALTIDGNGKKLSTTSEIRAFKVGSSATVAFKNLTLTGFVSGGGPAINNSGTIVLDGCTISNCHVSNSNGGGAIENKGSSSKLYAINTTFSGNYSGEIGGAINNYRGSLYMSGCTFINNYTTKSDAYYGGAIGINGGSEVRLINCSFSGNKYGTNTGTNDIGVYSKPTNYTIAGCTGVTIASDDGDITTIASGTATLDYSDLSNISFTYNAE